ncbi:MAG: ABC transporter ATP-binding protein [Bacteroidetes bacterium]|nr:MAG: ABC transporter ATP-binding protein [Bacteroidota bacterium]
MQAKNDIIIQVENLTVAFQNRAGIILPNDNITFSHCSGEWLGIMGPSGSGKSVLVRSIAGMVSGYPGIVDGNIFYHKQNLLEGLSEFCSYSRSNGTPGSVKKRYDAWQKRHWKNLSTFAPNAFTYIFQNPYDALNPYVSIKKHVEEAFLAGGVARADIQRESEKLLLELNFSEPARALKKYPHELSGGMAQRIVIAMALAQQSSVIIADECTTSLDPRSSKQTIDALHKAQEQRGCSLLFITHDVGLASEHSDRIIKMKEGKIIDIVENRSVHKQKQGSA